MGTRLVLVGSYLGNRILPEMGSSYSSSVLTPVQCVYTTEDDIDTPTSFISCQKSFPVDPHGLLFTERLSLLFIMDGSSLSIKVPSKSGSLSICGKDESFPAM